MAGTLSISVARDPIELMNRNSKIQTSSRQNRRTSLTVQSAGKKGRGVFANRTFKRNEVVEVSPNLLLSRKEHQSILSTRLAHYVFDAGQGRAFLGLGLLSLYNHSEAPNARWRERSGQCIEIRALRGISKGEEITIDYGFDPARPQTWPKELRGKSD